MGQGGQLRPTRLLGDCGYQIILLDSLKAESVFPPWAATSPALATPARLVSLNLWHSAPQEASFPPLPQC